MSAQLAVQAVLSVLPAIPAGRPVEGTLTAVDMAITPGGVVTGVDAVEVEFPAGRQACRWLASFAAEVVADPSSTWPGRSVLLLTLGDMPVVVGTIQTPTPEVDDSGI